MRLLDDLGHKAMARRQLLYERGELLGAEQMCERLAIDDVALRQAVGDGRMFWVEGPSGEHWYPGFFVDHAGVRHDIERVAVALNPLPGAVKWAFFTTPKYSLHRQTPVKALRGGQAASVLRTAVEFAERNRGPQSTAGPG